MSVTARPRQIINIEGTIAQTIIVVDDSGEGFSAWRISQSVKVTPSVILSLLWWEDEQQLTDLEG